MSDLLSIARSGVVAYSRALEVVAENVANAGTPGYVRRTSSLGPAMVESGQPPLELSPIGGSGVRITSISRAVDLLRTDTLRRAEGQVYALNTMDRWLTSVQSALTGPNSLDKPVAELFASISALAADPTSLAVRAKLLTDVDTLADSFNRSADDLARIDTDLVTEAKTEAAQLTGLAKALADVNAQLRRANTGSNAEVVLADERDRILSSMATFVTFEVRLDARGQATVLVPDAGGPALVEGEFARSATIERTGGWLTMRIGDGNTSEPAALLGGSIAGLSQSRVQLTQAIAGLDGLADRFAAEFNATHAAGVDLAGNAGLPLFTTTRAIATAAPANGGTARITAELAPGATPPDMNLVHDGSSWVLSRVDGSASVSGGLPLSLDGLTVNSAGGEPRNGDLHRITTVAGARGIGAAALAPSEVAAAPAWLAEAMPSNTGTGTVQVRSGTPAPIPGVAPFRVETLADGSLQLLDDAGTLLAAGQAGEWLEGDGFAVRVQGLPQEGDMFLVEETGHSDGGNGNALALLALRDAQTSGGTLGEQQDLLVSGIAVPLGAARSRADVAIANRDAAAQILNQISGVDLNVEASEMLRLQQAYQANSRIIQTAREVFDAILNATA